MAKQLQLRRGTTVQNDAFTGAVGELTLDTDTGEIRVHDGATQGGAEFIDAVVEFQKPTAQNNYTWYRKYASGWVEQGGKDTATTYGTTAKQVVLPVEMADNNYSVMVTKIANTTGDLDGAGVAPQVAAITTTDFYWSVTYTSALGRNINWRVEGMAA